MRISAPPFLHPCYFGTDIPTEDQLIAHGRTVEEIRQMIGADSLSYPGTWTGLASHGGRTPHLHCLL